MSITEYIFNLPQIIKMYLVGIKNMTRPTTRIKNIARRLRKGTVKLNKLEKREKSAEY